MWAEFLVVVFLVIGGIWTLALSTDYGLEIRRLWPVLLGSLTCSIFMLLAAFIATEGKMF